MGNSQSFIPDYEETNEVFEIDSNDLVYSKSATYFQIDSTSPDEEHKTPLLKELELDDATTKKLDDIMTKIDVQKKYVPPIDKRIDPQTMHGSKLSVDSNQEGQSTCELEDVRTNERKRKKETMKKIKRTNKRTQLEKGHDSKKTEKSDTIDLKIERPVPIKFRSYEDLTGIPGSSSTSRNSLSNEDEVINKVINEVSNEVLNKVSNGIVNEVPNPFIASNEKENETRVVNNKTEVMKEVLALSTYTRTIRELIETIQKDHPEETEVIGLLQLCERIIKEKIQSISTITI